MVVPQYVGRREFLDRLRAVADESGVAFAEVVLTDDSPRIAARFRTRRAEHVARGEPHPEYDVADDAIDRVVAGAQDALVREAGARRVAVIYAGAGLEAAYRDLLEEVPR